MPNIEQLEAEKNDLEQRYNAIERELEQMHIAYLLIIGGLLGYSLGLVIASFCHWLED